MKATILRLIRSHVSFGIDDKGVDVMSRVACLILVCTLLAALFGMAWHGSLIVLAATVALVAAGTVAISRFLG